MKVGMTEKTYAGGRALQLPKSATDWERAPRWSATAEFEQAWTLTPSVTLNLSLLRT